MVTKTIPLTLASIFVYVLLWNK